MATVYRDDDVDLGVLQERPVAVVGTTGEATALALCLRDSGVDVRLGLPSDASGRETAEAEGLVVVVPDEACEKASVVVLVGPAALQRRIFDAVAGPSSLQGDAVLFTSAEPLRAGLAAPPGVDICVVAPQGPARLVRSRFADGGGVPALVSVHRDATGEALAVALAYARALGTTRAGALLTSVPEQADAAVLAWHTVGVEGLGAVLEATYSTLVAEGCDADVAYLACLTAVRQATDVLIAGGLAGVAETRRRAGAAGGPALVAPADLRNSVSRLAAELRAPG